MIAVCMGMQSVSFIRAGHRGEEDLLIRIEEDLSCMYVHV